MAGWLAQLAASALKPTIMTVKLPQLTIFVVEYLQAGSSPGSPGLHFRTCWRLEMEDRPSQTIMA